MKKWTWMSASSPRQTKILKRNCRGEISRRPLLPPECDTHPSPGVAGAPGRHSFAGKIFSRAVPQIHGKAHRRNRAGGHAAPGELRLAGKCPRVGEYH